MACLIILPFMQLQRPPELGNSNSSGRVPSGTSRARLKAALGVTDKLDRHPFTHLPCMTGPPDSPGLVGLRVKLGVRGGGVLVRDTVRKVQHATMSELRGILESIHEKPDRLNI